MYLKYNFFFNVKKVNYINKKITYTKYKATLMRIGHNPNTHERATRQQYKTDRSTLIQTVFNIQTAKQLYHQTSNSPFNTPSNKDILGL